MTRALKERRMAVAAPAGTAAHSVAIGPMGLGGILSLPPAARGVVAFAHGSGSSRFSPRNTRVATHLQSNGLATLLFDLLLPDEAEDRANVFDIELLAARLSLATDWLRQFAKTRGLRVGYFGASTGAAAALVAAAQRNDIGAVVSRGGRPDLAGPFLARVRSPTLLLVGGRDTQVLALNREALDKLRCEKQLIVVPGATHLFEEPGTLEAVTEAAGHWFVNHLLQPRALTG